MHKNPAAPPQHNAAELSNDQSSEAHKHLAAPLQHNAADLTSTTSPLTKTLSAKTSFLLKEAFVGYSFVARALCERSLTWLLRVCTSTAGQAERGLQHNAHALHSSEEERIAVESSLDYAPRTREGGWG